METTEIKVKENGKKIRYINKGIPMAPTVTMEKPRKFRGWPKKITCYCCFKKDIDFKEATFVSGGSGFGRSYFLCPACSK